MFGNIVVLLVAVIVASCAPQAKQLRPHFDGRIVGGDDADIEDYPYQLSLQDNGRHYCGAAIIGETWAITAGHCAYGREAESLTVRAASSILQSGGQVVKVKALYSHPQFDLYDIDYDIALLELEENIKFSNSSSAITLVDASTKITYGDEATVTGWGVVNEGDGHLPNQLQVVKVPLISNEDCNVYYSDMITSRMLCAGYVEGGKDACQGDSGGPLVVAGKLVGLVSWGHGCAEPNYPGVYSSVAALRDFVTETAGI